MFVSNSDTYEAIRILYNNHHWEEKTLINAFRGEKPEDIKDTIKEIRDENVRLSIADQEISNLKEELNLKTCENENCGKAYNPDEHTWSAGFGCDHYCSRKCCLEVWHNQTASPEALQKEEPTCPCY